MASSAATDRAEVDPPPARAASVSAPLRTALLGLVLALVALALGPALRGELVYDDLWLVARNPSIESLAKLPDAFTHAHWDVADPEQAARVGYWRPLTSVALFVGRALGGGQPAAFHAVSLALHLVATWLAFLLAERWTRSTVVALWAAVLFGLHPVQVEAVAWISAVNDPLSGVLVLAALHAHLRWRERGSPGTPWIPAVYVALALLAKESAIAWFPLALALDAGRELAPGESRYRPFARAFLPALGALFLYWLARVAVFGDLAAGFDRVTSHLFPDDGALHLRELTLRLELLGGALGLLVAPLHLNLFREVRPEIPRDDPALWLAILAIAAWCAATWFARRRGARIAFASLLMIAAALAPAFARVESIGRFPLSERFLYVAVFGLAVLVAACVTRWLPSVAGALLLAVLAAACGIKSHARTAFWRDEETVFTESALASPRSVYVQWGLGRVLMYEYQRTGELAKLDRARVAFETAQDVWSENPPDPQVLKTFPDILQANVGVGWVHVFCAQRNVGECTMDEAELVFRGILKKFPDSEEAYCGLGVALQHQDKLDDAEQAFRRALENNQKHIESWINLGRLQLTRGKWGDALESFDRCVQLAPDDVDARVWLATAAIETGANDRARRELAKARELAPRSAGPLVQLGVLAAREGHFDTAVELFESALKLDGARGDAHLLRAKALLQAGKTAQAIDAFQDAIRWLQEPSGDPSRPQQLFEAFYNLSVVLISRGQGAQALPFLENALALQPEGPYAAQLREELDKLKSQGE